MSSGYIHGICLANRCEHLRFGNKSVISTIRSDTGAENSEYSEFMVVPDDRMSMTMDGRRIDIMNNALSTFNRNIPFALYEPYLNMIFDRSLQHVKDWDTDKQFEFIMDLIREINPNYANDLLVQMTAQNVSKKEYMQNAYEEGIYLRVENFETTLTLRDSLVKIYRKYPDMLKSEKLKVWYPPRQEYIDSILPCVVGDSYVLILKQDGIKGASARNAGGVSPEGLPIKSNNKSNYMAEMSDTALKLGEYDRLTFNIGITNADLMKYIMLMRTSVEGRGWLEKAIYNPDTPIPERFENRAARINNCYLKVLGVELDPVPKQNQLKVPSPDTLQTYRFRNSVVTMSEYDMYWMYKIALRYNRIVRKELKKNRDYDSMTIWNYAFRDTDYPEGWLTEEKKQTIMKFVDDILLTNK